MKKLSKLQQRVYDRFCLAGMDDDIAISTLYISFYRKQVTRATTTRQMQQQLGPLIARINAKLEATKIVPGNLKQTYRIIKR